MTTLQPSDVRTSPAGGAKVMLAAWLLLLGVALVWATVSPYAMFMVFGVAASVVVTLPMLGRNYSLVSPWSILALSVYVGCGFRSLFVALDPHGGERPFTSYLLLDRPVEYFTSWSALYLVALGLAALVYSLPRRRYRSSPSHFRGWERFNDGFSIAVAALAIVGFIAFALYVQRTGGLSSGISGKRMVISNHNVAGADYSAHGILLLINSCSGIAFMMTLAKFTLDGKSYSLFTLRGWALLLLLANSVVLPFYASSRTSIVYLLLGAAAIVLMIRRQQQRPVSIRPLLVAGLGAIVLFTAITNLRSSSGTSAVDDQATFINSATDSLVYNRNLADIPTSALIMGSVGTALEPKGGETLTAWLVAPVPRSVWPDKPIISIGPEIGHNVYGTDRAGVPPGFIAESYWNFGVLGVIAGSLLLGAALRRVDKARIRHEGNIGFAVLYVIVLIPFAGQIFASTIGQAIFNLAVSGVFAALAMRVACSPRLGSARSVRGRPAVPARIGVR